MSRISMLEVYICYLFYRFVGRTWNGDSAVPEVEKSCLELDSICIDLPA